MYFLYFKNQRNRK